MIQISWILSSQISVTRGCGWLTLVRAVLTELSSDARFPSSTVVWVAVKGLKLSYHNG